MTSEKQRIQKCKEIVRGIVDGDKAVSMLILNKSGIAVSETVKKEVRSSETLDMGLLSKAVDVYLNLECFIGKDRHDKNNEAVECVHRLIESVNQLNGETNLYITISVSSWKFTLGGHVFKYIRGKYDKRNERDLYQFILSVCNESELLQRVFAVLASENI